MVGLLGICVLIDFARDKFNPGIAKSPAFWVLRTHHGVGFIFQKKFIKNCVRPKIFFFFISFESGWFPHQAIQLFILFQ